MAGHDDVLTPAPGAADAGSAYRLLWRWHFFAGLMVAPIVIMLAVTGALYLYGDEIEGMVYGDVLTVTPSAKQTTAAVQEAAVLSAFEGSRIIRLTLPEQPDRAAEWMILTQEGDTRTVLVDPADARIIGTLDSDTRLMAVVGGLHGELMLGSTGDLIVEFASCWTIVLLVTGTFLWWPRQKRLAGNAYPRLAAGGRRFWRDLHAVPSFWNLPIIAFLLLTGLPWSGFWGGKLAELGTLSSSPGLFAPTPNFSAPPSANNSHPATLEQHEHTGDLPWSIRQAPLPPRQGTGDSTTIDDLVQIANARGIWEAGLRVIYPMDADGVYTLSFVPDSATDQHTVHVNPADGSILQDVTWAEYSVLGKTVEYGVLIHMGRQFGEANRIILLASCLLLVATVLFGLVTWWKRRPPGRLAAPPRPGNVRYGVILPVACALGILFPLAGASMVVFAAIEWLLGRQAANA